MKHLLSLSFSHMARGRGQFLSASIGLIVGTATLVFFLALSTGIRERVLNRLYPVNLVEFQPEKVRMFGLGVQVPSRIDDVVVAATSRLDGVAAAYPKQRSLFPARLWGGGDILGATARVEAFFDGLSPSLISAELRNSETAVLGPELTGSACGSGQSCGSGSFCDNGVCRRNTWWNRFEPTAGTTACRVDETCRPGESCIDSVCSVRCGDGAACPEGFGCRAGSCRALCVEGRCDEGAVCASDGMCSRLACSLESARVQQLDDLQANRGSVSGVVDGIPTGALPVACPDGTYCAAVNALSTTGFCERPIPVLLSPFLLDVYNDVAATALGMKRLSGLEVAIGINFAMMFGESYFGEDAPAAGRIVRRCRVVGFSDKALQFGVTMPLEDAVRANALMKGSDAASRYTSLVVETDRNEDVPSIVEDLKVLGLVLAPGSENGRKAAEVLAVITLVFLAVSVVILGISAVNIAHTFQMLVAERRREIAVYRAVGATAGQIRFIVSAEAFFLGLAGGPVGIVVGMLLGVGADAAAAPLLSRIPGSPESLFLFSAPVICAGMACAILFSLVGAWVPARRASATDPARVLSQG